MHLYLYILLYYLILPKTLSKQVEIECPVLCKCDIFEKLLRARCTQKNLAKIESNLPQQANLLDISYNQITEFNDRVFMDEKLTNLKLLNVSHNKVSHIHMNAFQGLTDLKTLDLSFNGIRYITKNWFWSFGSLEELYLRGNSFIQIQNEPLFESKTLKRLDLGACQISYIGDDAFSELPSLEILDVSDNNLIHLEIAVVQHLPNVNIINVNNNPLTCDGVSENLTSYCSKKGIRIKNPCEIKILQSKMFERMVNMGPEPEDEKNSWIYDDGEEEIKDNKTKTMETCNNTIVDKSLLQEIVDLSPLLSIIIPFIYGIAVGVLIAYIVHIFTEKKEDLNESTYLSFDDAESHLSRSNSFPRRKNSLIRKNRFSRISRQSTVEERQTLPMIEWNLSESTPVLYRKNQNVNL